jgi:hypothetical protein
MQAEDRHDVVDPARDLLTPGGDRGGRYVAFLEHCATARLRLSLSKPPHGGTA